MFILVLIQVKRNERDIKQIESWITEGKYTRMNKQKTVYSKIYFFSSAQSVFLCCVWLELKRKCFWWCCRKVVEQLMPDSYLRERKKRWNIDWNNRRGHRNDDDDRSQLLPFFNTGVCRRRRKPSKHRMSRSNSIMGYSIN
jgi:hypothetical protein